MKRISCDGDDIHDDKPRYGRELLPVPIRQVRPCQLPPFLIHHHHPDDGDGEDGYLLPQTKSMCPLGLSLTR